MPERQQYRTPVSNRDPLPDQIHRDRLVAIIEGPHGQGHKRTGNGGPLADAIIAFGWNPDGYERGFRDAVMCCREMIQAMNGTGA